MLNKENAYVVYDKYLSDCVNLNKKVRIIMNNGYQMRGYVVGYDTVSIQFDEIDSAGDRNSCIIFRNNISTIMLGG